MRLSDITDQTADAVRQVGAYLDDLTTPTLRIGVTGLARAGKTVFITALVEALVGARAKPALGALKLPGFRAFLEPQPDDDVPRFAIETHLATINADPPAWPESTRHISQLRLTLEWEASDWARRSAGIRRRLHLDIVDYPGEWLADIGLFAFSFDDWCDHVLGLARQAPVAASRDELLAFADKASLDIRDPEQVALEGAGLYKTYLAALKDAGRLAPSAGPGRFLMPGDFDGSPLLTFFPLGANGAEDGSLRQLLTRRFESYKGRVVRPFFERHFSRIDRQIVLVDVLSALNHGPSAMLEMENALERALRAFRPGRGSWLWGLLGHRIDRILFAATKADHVNRVNHARLAAITRKLIDRAARRAESAGAIIESGVIAALRATEDVERIASSGEPLPCIRGFPLGKETLDGRRIDPEKAITLFPGDLPADPLDAFDPDVMRPGSLSFIRFRPPLATGEPAPSGSSDWPHIGLGGTVRFLIGDRLA